MGIGPYEFILFDFKSRKLSAQIEARERYNTICFEYVLYRIAVDKDILNFCSFTHVSKSVRSRGV